jgi:hypothetical protein
MLIKILILVFILYVLTRIYARYRKQDINGRELGIWIAFWVIVGVVVIIPQKTDLVAKFLGIGRGADLLVYVSILVLFYLIFQILVRLERLDHDLTEIVRHIALSEVFDDERGEEEEIKVEIINN